MAFLQLNHGVSYGLVDARAIFLDTRRDRYFALDLPQEEAIRALAADHEAPGAHSAARETLLATGLFSESALRGRIGPAVVGRPDASLLDEDPPRRAGWLASYRVWKSVSNARKRLATSSLAVIVDGLREHRFANPARGDAAAAERRARIFLAARMVVPIPRSCLLDSLALLDWLGRDASHATLVFGVRLDPFGAHCWLQTSGTVLTDARDAIAGFAPVMTI